MRQATTAIRLKVNSVHQFRAGVARALKWQAVMTIGRQLLSLVVFTTLARLLAPSDFGLMGLTYVYLMLTGILTDQGFSTALIQKAQLRPSHWNSAFWFNLGSATALCMGTIALASPLARLLGEPRVASLLQWSSLSLVFSAASSIQSTMLIREMDFRRLAIRTLLANLFGGLIGIGMALSGWGVWALVGQQLTTSLVGSAFMWAVSSFRPALRFSWADMRDLFGVSSSVFINTLIWVVVVRLDQLVIARFGGADALGFYVVAGKVPELAKAAITQPINDVSLPAFSRLQDDYGRMRQAIYRGMGLNAVVMFAVFVGLAVTSSDLVPILFGNKWAAASGLFSLLSIYCLINALQVFGFPALLASGLNRQYVALSLSHATGVLVACLVGIPFGVEYVVLGLIVNALIQVVPCVALLRHRIGVSWIDYCRPCVAPASASCFMAGVVYLTALAMTPEMHPWWRLICHVAVGAASYIGFLSVFSRTTVDDLARTLNAAFRITRPLDEAPPR